MKSILKTIAAMMILIAPAMIHMSQVKNQTAMQQAPAIHCYQEDPRVADNSADEDQEMQKANVILQNRTQQAQSHEALEMAMH